VVCARRNVLFIAPIWKQSNKSYNTELAVNSYHTGHYRKNPNDIIHCKIRNPSKPTSFSLLLKLRQNYFRLDCTGDLSVNITVKECQRGHGRGGKKVIILQAI
jgi:hypothetical protein